MGHIESLVLAGAVLIAVPAAAQDNAAAPANLVANTAIEANAATTAPPINGPAPSGDQNATLPGQAAPAAQADDTSAPAPEEHHGFPWGVLGLIGLIGLLGVRKVKA